MKDIPGYEGVYGITPDGKVWRYKAEGLDTRNKPRKSGGYFLPLRLNRPGYYTVNLSKNAAVKTFYIHRLLAALYIPNPNNYPLVNHKNGIKTDNRLENLEWCTEKLNRMHAYKLGLIKQPPIMHGENNPRAKLTREKVREIRKARSEDKKTLHQLGEEFGVSWRTIWDVVTYRNWKI